MKKIILKVFYPITLLVGWIKAALYDISVYCNKRFKKKSISLSTQKKKDLVFYISFFTIPLIMLFFNLIIINGNSLLLSFKQYDTETYTSIWVGFGNFASVIGDFVTKPLFHTAVRNSVSIFLSLTIVTMILPIFVSYYIFKKYPGHKFFKIVLFIPSIISAVITVAIFKTITERMVPAIVKELFGKVIEGLLSNEGTAFNTIYFYSLFMSFGGGLLVNLAAMNTVDDSVTESAKLEGIGFFRELWHIVLPATYQVLSLNIIMSFSTLFTLDMNLFVFYGTDADAKFFTLGYYFTTQTLKATTFDYPYLAAWGLLTSVIAIPVTLCLRHLIYKHGPSEE